MNRDFVPSQQALALKELGFDDEVLKVYDINSSKSKLYNYGEVLTGDDELYAPLYQQVFRWFREKYDIQVSIQHWCKDSKIREYHYHIEYTYNDTRHSTSSIAEHQYNMFNYEEAELECLKKLIEIVKENKNG
jgi:hypothetical protein